MRKIKGRIILLISAVLICVFVWNYALNSMPSVSFYRLSTPKNIDGMRIVELADLHLSQYGKDNEVLLKKVSALGPDLIAVAGDMVLLDTKDYTAVLSLLEKLTNIAPVYYSPGNHEYDDILKNKNSTLIADINKTGAVYLVNSFKEVKNGTQTLVIGAICANADDVLKYKGTTNMLKDFCGQKKFKLLLSHYPEVFLENMKDYPVDLALCGHAHGGLVRLPFLKDGLYSPDQGFFPKLTSGMNNLCGSNVVVSRGLGNSDKISNWFQEKTFLKHFSFRFNNPPEIVVVDIN